MQGQDRPPIIPLRATFLDLCHYTVNVCAKLVPNRLVFLMQGLTWPLTPGKRNWLEKQNESLSKSIFDTNLA